MKRIIGVVSGKGGVGKTTLTANLGVSLLLFGEKAIAVDGDLGTSNLGIQLGLYNFPATLHDVLRGEIEILHTIYIHESGLRLVPASISLRYMHAESLKLRNALQKLQDTVLVDSPPGLNTQALNVLEACDEILLVTNPNTSAVTDTIKVKTIAQNLNKKILGAVINRFENNKYDLKIQDIQESLDIPVIGIIPEDKNIKKSAFFKTPLVNHDPISPASIAFKNLAANILDKEYNPPKFLKFKRFFKSLW